MVLLALGLLALVDLITAVMSLNQIATRSGVRHYRKFLYKDQFSASRSVDFLPHHPHQQLSAFPFLPLTHPSVLSFSYAGRSRWSHILLTILISFFYISLEVPSFYKQSPRRSSSSQSFKMVNYRIVMFAGLAAALPLNINLGAYSPALVVGKSTGHLLPIKYTVH